MFGAVIKLSLRYPSNKLKAVIVKNCLQLTLEIEAKNISSCSLADNSGVVKQDEIIDTSFEEVIRTNVEVNKVSELIKFSYDAGKFVCNNLYFHLLANYPNKSLFIHIPNCNDDENEKLESLFNPGVLEELYDFLISNSKV